MIHERWEHVGRDADGEVYVSEGVDLEGMREVRLGDGRRQRFRPDGPIDWLDTLTHWTVPRSEITYVTEGGEPAVAPWPPPPWRSIAPDVQGAWVAPVGTPPPTYPRRTVQWFGSDETVAMSHDFSTAPGDDDDA